MANLSADNNTDEDADDWDDDGLDYSEEIKKLPLAVRYGGIFCTNFEMVTEGDFSWDCIPALQIYEVVCNLRYIKPNVSDLHDLGVSQEQLVRGIEIFKAIKASAEPWARSLAQEFESIDDNDDDAESGLSLNDGVDCFVSDVADEEDDLGHIRKTDPILFGEICLETSRLLAARQQTSAQCPPVMAA